MDLPPAPSTADLDELRSEIAVLVAFAEQYEPLIPARRSGSLHRQRLVVTPHYGEIQKPLNRPPEFALLFCNLPSSASHTARLPARFPCSR